MGIDDDAVPESDPYCAHWASIFDEDHEDVMCEACGESCRDHPILFGAPCPDGPGRFTNASWPAGETSRRL